MKPSLFALGPWGKNQLIDAINHNDIIFVSGVSGTGKTFLSVAMAIAALKKKEIKHILLSRPAVEAGERLGFFTWHSKRKNISVPPPII